MTPNQIKHMVDRFLSWKLPENFRPDAGISFKATFNEHTAHPMKHEPSGTNLFDATQAEAMVSHMIDGMPTGGPDLLNEAAEEMLADHMTSEQHHPGHVLVPTSAFNKLRTAKNSANG